MFPIVSWSDVHFVFAHQTGCSSKIEHLKNRQRWTKFTFYILFYIYFYIFTILHFLLILGL